MKNQSVPIQFAQGGLDMKLRLFAVAVACIANAAVLSGASIHRALLDTPAGAVAFGVVGSLLSLGLGMALLWCAKALDRYGPQ